MRIAPLSLPPHHSDPAARDFLARVLKQNGYPANFIRNASTPPMQETADMNGRDEEQEEKEPLVVPLSPGRLFAQC